MTTNMQTNNLKQNIGRKLLLLILPIFLAVGFAAPSAQADDHHRHGGRGPQHADRGRGYGHAYRGGGYYGGRGYRHGYYSGRHGNGYWRYHHGHRYWYEDGGYFLYPGGTSINIVL